MIQEFLWWQKLLTDADKADLELKDRPKER